MSRQQFWRDRRVSFFNISRIAKKRNITETDYQRVLTALDPRNQFAVDMADVKLAFEYAIVNNRGMLVEWLLNSYDISFFIGEEGDPIESSPVGHLLSGKLADGTSIQIDQPLLDRLFSKLQQPFLQKFKPLIDKIKNDPERRPSLMAANEGVVEDRSQEVFGEEKEEEKKEEVRRNSVEQVH